MKNYIQTCSNVLRHAMLLPIATFLMLGAGLALGSHLAYTMCLLVLAPALGFSIIGDILLAIALVSMGVMHAPFFGPFACLVLYLYRFTLRMDHRVASCWSSFICCPYVHLETIWKSLNCNRVRIGSKHLFFLCVMFLPTTYAVCLQCHGAAVAFGCKGDASSCPFATGVAKNAAAIATAGSSALAISKLLPLWVVRCFSASSLRVILALAKRSRSTEDFDPSDKVVGEILRAVQQGLYPKDDAIQFCTDKADAIKLLEIPDERLRRMTAIKEEWRNGAADLRTMKVDCESRREDESNTSALLYILALLSARICTASKAEEFSLVVEEDDSSSTGSRSKRVAASLKRPTNEGQMARLLNMWILVCQATGVATCLTLSSFVDEVVFQPVADQVYPWQVAFEVAVAYLMKAEASDGVYEIGTIREKMGGIDAIRTAAEAKAKEEHGSKFFRTPGGNPGTSSQPRESDIKGNPSSKKGCACWNLGTPHSAKHLDTNGKCKFCHACDHWIDEKDENGNYKICLGSGGTPGHKRGQCDHPNKLASKPKGGK